MVNPDALYRCTRCHHTQHPPIRKCDCGGIQFERIAPAARQATPPAQPHPPIIGRDT